MAFDHYIIALIQSTSNVTGFVKCLLYLASNCVTFAPYILCFALWHFCFILFYKRCGLLFAKFFGSGSCSSLHFLLYHACLI